MLIKLIIYYTDNTLIADVEAKKSSFDNIALVNILSKNNINTYEKVKSIGKGINKYMLVDLDTGYMVANKDNIKDCENYFNDHIDEFEKIKKLRWYEQLKENYKKICNEGTLFE